MLLHEFFDQSCGRFPDKTAVIAGGREYAYREVDRMADILGQRLAQGGVRRGDRVAIFLDNGIEFIVSLLATLRLGSVVMPVNPLTRTDKLAYMLNDAEAAAMVTQGGLAEIWQPALRRNASVRCSLVTDAPAPAELTAPAEVYPDMSRTASAPICRCAMTIDQDLAGLIYTSGSTGDPKGVMLTHLNMVSAARSVSTYLGLCSDDIILCALPLSFDYGLYQVLMSFLTGATLVLELSFAFPLKVLQVMERERVTVFPGVPTMYSMLMNLGALERFRLESLRLLTNTAAALSEEHIRCLRALFPQATLFSMYGLTECKRVTYLPPEQLDVRPTSVGRGMPNEEVWLVDEDGRRLPNGSTGELVIRGSNVMRGYWRKPIETAACLKPGPIAGEMLLYSGDLFRTDEEGWLYFVARKDDIIKSRGEKVSPREVENVLYSIDGVVDAAVVGTPDELLGQAVKAFLVLREDCTLSARDVIRHCLERLEPFMAPKYVEFVAALPRTNTGKISKSSLS